MGARRVTEPAVEPLTLEEAKAHLRYTLADQDGRITDAIRSARDAVERYCERALLTQTWELQGTIAAPGLAAGAVWGLEVTDSHVDWFTRNLLATRAWPPGPVAGGLGIALPWAAPLDAVLTVTLDGTALEPTGWVTNATTEPATLYLADGGAGWLVATYRCGAPDAATLAPALKQAVYALLGVFFRYRGDEIEPEPDASELPLEVARILDPFRLGALV